MTYRSPRNNITKRTVNFRFMIGLITVSAMSICRADNQTELVRAAVAGVAPSVVRIRTIGDPGSDSLSVSSQTTTGIVISDQGEVLTSSFGFSGQPAAIFVEDRDGQYLAASVVATDHIRKLVLLKCTNGSPGNRGFPKAAKRWPDVGATAIAVGKFYPDTTPSISVGIISAVKRIHGLAIQTDAKISPVNYGGPLIGLDGRVLGLLVPLSTQDAEGVAAGVEWYDSGIGFCIPIQDALRAAAELRKGSNRTRGRIGIGLSTKNPLASDAEISVVHPQSPAATAGLQAGDVIVSINDRAIGRLGHLQEIVKSAYAGETLQFQVKRGDDIETFAVKLTERLQIPKQGYIGLIIHALVRDADDLVAGVSIRIINDGPAEQAKLPDSSIITQWNDRPIKSVTQLQRSLQLTFVDREVSVRFRRSLDAAEESVSFAATLRPDQLEPVKSDLLTETTSAAQAIQWQRSEVPLKDDLGRAWLWAPEVSADLKSGYLILLSESETPVETILRRWRDICEQHNLILIVPSAAGETNLTREHAAVVQQSLLTAARGRGVDNDRVVIVAGTPQADLASRLLFHPRARSFSKGVFIDCRPRASGLSEEVVLKKSIAALMLTGKIQSRQATALQRLAVSDLRDAGVWLTESTADNATFASPEEQIATWAFRLKTR